MVSESSGSLISYDSETDFFQGLTTAHSFFHEPKKSLKAIFHCGFHDNEDFGTIEIQSYRIHPDYDPAKKFNEYDLCLFYGKFKGEEENKISFINTLSRVKILDDPQFILPSCTLIHYPFRTNFQRITEKLDIFRTYSKGQSLNLIKHYAYTLQGSSGGIFFYIDENKNIILVAVHQKRLDDTTELLLINWCHRESSETVTSYLPFTGLSSLLSPGIIDSIEKADEIFFPNIGE